MRVLVTRKSSPTRPVLKPRIPSRGMCSRESREVSSNRTEGMRKSPRRRKPVTYKEEYSANSDIELETLAEPEKFNQAKIRTVRSRAAMRDPTPSNKRSPFINVKRKRKKSSGSRCSDSGVSSKSGEESAGEDVEVEPTLGRRSFRRALSASTLRQSEPPTKRLRRRHTETFIAPSAGVRRSARLSITVPSTVPSNGLRRSSRLSSSGELVTAGEITLIKSEPGVPSHISDAQSNKLVNKSPETNYSSITVRNHRLQNKQLLDSGLETRQPTPSSDSGLSLVPSSVPLSRGTSVGDSSDSGAVSDDQSTQSSSHNDSACHWKSCRANVKPSELIDHMERNHISPQSKVFKCYWIGCKVYGQVSRSQKWLDSHIRKHMGSRPYYCIVQNCTLQFGTRQLLQKHVDSHFAVAEVKVSQRQPSTPSKARRNRKRLRGTQTCLPPTVDFVSPSIMQYCWWRITTIQNRWGHLLDKRKEHLLFHGEVVGSMISKNSQSEHFQLHWYPEEFLLPDSWYTKEEFEKKRTRLVKLNLLPGDVLLGIP